MYYVGIDIAKQFHIACVLDESNKYLVKNFRIESEISEYSHLNLLLINIDTDRSKF
ncbi:MAG: hypothetical protein L3J19_02535 [Sulfurimonas sp.]|nr:hypothetical protein [Sulfurimonas sp.]